MLEENNAKDLEAITEQKGIREINILFLDISSTCTGYSIATVDFHSKKVNWKKAGALWLDNPEWSHQDKYLFMHEAIVNYFWIVEQIDYIVAEHYSFNKNKLMGVQVVPEMQGAIKCAAAFNGVKVTTILPQSWRKELEVKPAFSKDKNGKKKKDYKGPTKVKINELVEVPLKSISNISGKERNTPSDLYDAIGVGYGWLKRMGFHKQTFKGMQFNTHLGRMGQ